MENNVGSKFLNIIQDMYDICQSAVKISNRHSEYFNVEMEVKQGVSFRPTLFNYYINDIHDIFDGSCDPLQLDSTYISSLSFADFFRLSYTWCIFITTPFRLNRRSCLLSESGNASIPTFDLFSQETVSTFCQIYLLIAIFSD